MSIKTNRLFKTISKLFIYWKKKKLRFRVVTHEPYLGNGGIFTLYKFYSLNYLNC